MNKLTRVVNRALAASPAEWSCRTQQLWFGLRNAAGSSFGRSALPPDGHLAALGIQQAGLEDWWASQPLKWFRIDQQRIELWRQLADDETSCLPWMLQQADLVVDGQMPLFSYPPIDFQGPDRWHRDSILGQVSDRKFHGFVEYLNPAEVGDSKHVWEPNRFAWAIWLGVAHRLTGEDRYRSKFVELTSDWFQQNPYPLGINYCSALESAFRSLAWLWSMELFSDYLSEDTELLNQLVRGLWVAGRHIENNLSYYFAPNTHLTGEALGLLATGLALPSLGTDANRWRELGERILVDESTHQFHEDGTHRELSSGYHIYSTDFYVFASLLARQVQYSISDQIPTAAVRFARRLAELSPQDYLLPQWNDNDGGRLFWGVPQPLDAAPTLMAAESLLDPDSDEPGMLHAPLTPRGYPLLTCDADQLSLASQQTDQSHIPGRRESQRNFDSGLATYRNAAGDYVLFRAGPFGYMDYPHSHDAPLGVLFHLGGYPIVVDNGTGAYTQDMQQRNQFRTGAGKNILRLDGRGPSVPGGDFSWQSVTDCQMISVHQDESGFRACGGHSGYSRQGMQVFVHREVTAVAEGVVAVVDRWDADSGLSLQAAFTLHPDLKLDLDHGVMHLTHPNWAVHFHSSGLDGEPVRLSSTPVAYSANYGQMGMSQELSIRPPELSRGGIVTIFSRVGQIVAQPNGIYSFADRPGLTVQALSDKLLVRRESGTVVGSST